MKDLKDTIFLPKTNYQLRPDFLKTEPDLIAEWKQKNIYNIRNEEKTETFVLHSGPTYSNGKTHIGHALNMIMKDIITRAQSMGGKIVNFIPGWDSHGLPIEWQVEEQYRKAGKNKNDDILEFLKDCRDYAAKWVQIQAKEFQRLGVCADFENPYLTMDFQIESWIASEVRGFSHNMLYRDFRPVFWSPVEQTALAEAEVEYQDKQITSLYVKFPIKRINGLSNSSKASLVAWTTTPWTLPCNKALAFNNQISYGTYRVIEDSNNFSVDEILIISKNLVETFLKDVSVKIEDQDVDFMKDILVCKHPFTDEDVPVLHADFVTDSTGTGIVHIAPSYGLDDFYFCKTNNIGLTDYVQKNGTYKSDMPVFGGMHVYKVLEAVVAALKDGDRLCGEKPMTHSTAVSWRSKAPLIYLATQQWFIPMDKPGLDGLTIRQKALRALDDVTFIPENSKNRLVAMIENRPDWCISRQRAWGVPITLFVDKKSGEVLHDVDVDGDVSDIIEKEGLDAWFKHPSEYFLGSVYNPDDYEKITDVVDVWFESGCSFAYVLEKRNILKADVYLEGSDQHRGWFQASLIQSVAFTFNHSPRQKRGDAPFKTLITNGFVLDKNGQKMSKSLGNVIAPDTIINEYGADVLRLWVATSDTNEDIRIGNEVMKQLSEIYRKLRNTLRYLTGALCETKMTMTIPDVETTHYINNSFRVPVVNLEHYVLLKVDMINRLVIKALENHDWKKVITEIHNFCVNDLSALYFDARKDVLYCGDFPSPIDMTPEFKTTSRVFAERETTINMMQFLFHHLVRWLAPVLPFATEEAWQSIFGNTSSIHTQTFDIKPITLGMDEFERMFEFSEYWQKMKSIRSDIMKELEDLRNKKVIRSSLEAMVTLDQTLTINSPEKWAFKDWENFLGVSMINSWIIAPPGYQGKLFKVKKIIGHSKCDRCWKVNVKGSLSHPVEGATRLCERCILQS